MHLKVANIRNEILDVTDVKNAVVKMIMIEKDKIA